MKQIKLNQNQIIKLLSENFVKINDYEFINIHNGITMYTNNGFEFECKSMNINFYNNLNNDILEIKNIRNIVCDYLNLEQNQVIYSNQNETNEIVFKIRLTQNIEGKIIVYNNEDALNVMKDIDSDILKYLKKDNTTLGIYKRLGKSNYYFRWLEDF